jgi:hypothetical protein
VAETQFHNLGKVNNHGIETLLNATVLDTRPLKHDITFNLSTNHNKLKRLGAGVAPIIIGFESNQRHQEGYPLGGFWAVPYTYNDANGDHIISPSEVTLGDSEVFIGNAYPTREWSITNGVTLFKYFKISALLDHKGGFKIMNDTRYFRCVIFNLCREAFDKNAPLSDQAARIAGRLGSTRGYHEKGDFTKLRELSFTVTAPEDWAKRLGGEGLSLTVAGRNLKTWTDYSGFDPEVQGTSRNFSIGDFLTQPPVRYWTTRLNLTF